MKNLKSICFITNSFPNATETFVVNYIKEAIEAGYSVKILSHIAKNKSKSSQPEIIEKYGLISKTYRIYYGIPKSKFLKLIKGFFLIFRYFNYVIKIKGIETKRKYFLWPFIINFYSSFRNADVMSIQFANAGCDLFVLKEIGFIDSKLITTFHGHDAHFKTAQEKELLSQKLSKTFTLSDVLTVNSSYLKNKLLALGCEESKIIIKKMLIDTDLFVSNNNSVPTRDDTIRLVSVGRLIELKGYSYAVKSIGILIKKGFRVNYEIIGEGPLKEELLKNINDLGLQKNVNLLGKKNQDEIINILKNSHIFLMSSVTDSDNRAEAQGVVISEAHSMWLPVVAFDSGGVAENIINKKTGYLVKERDIQAYSDAILKLIDDKEIYKAMSKRAREFAVEKYSLKNKENGFIDLY